MCEREWRDRVLLSDDSQSIKGRTTEKTVSSPLDETINQSDIERGKMRKDSQQRFIEEENLDQATDKSSLMKVNVDRSPHIWRIIDLHEK